MPMGPVKMGILKALEDAQGGLTAEDIAIAMGTDPHELSGSLQSLRHSGKIDYTYRGYRTRVWVRT